MNTDTNKLNQQLKHSGRMLEKEQLNLLAKVLSQDEVTTAQLQSAVDALNLIISIRRNAGKGIL